MPAFRVTGSVRRGAAAALALVLAAGTAACGARRMPAPSSGAAGPALRVLVFYDDRAEAPRGTILPLIAANRSAIWELAPLWYQVAADGSVRDLSESDVQTFARSNGIKLMPLVVNLGGTSSFLLQAGDCSAGPCAKAVSNLVSIVKAQNYDGLNIDFELLQPAARDGLTAFVHALHQRLSALQRVLTVDVIPAGSRRQAGGAYNFAALAKDSDDVVLMSYDAHDDTSAPGAIAPLAWVKTRLNVALGLGVPPSKLILGIADYGYDWSSSGHGVTIGVTAAQQLASARGLTVSRTADGSPHFTYTSGGTTHTVWFEDGRSIVPKIQLARQSQLKGLALWMAGYESAAYWEALRSAAGSPAGSAAALPGASSAASPAPRASSSNSAQRPASSSASSAASGSASGAASGSASGAASGSASGAGSAGGASSSATAV